MFELPFCHGFYVINFVAISDCSLPQVVVVRLDTSRSGIWVSLSHGSWDSLTNWRPTVGWGATGFFWAIQWCMENVLAIMVDRFFFVMFFLVLAILLPFLPRCYVYDLYISIYVFIFDFSFAMSALSSLITANMNTMSQIFGHTPKKSFENRWFEGWKTFFWKREPEFLGVPLTDGLGSRKAVKRKLDYEWE